MLAQWLHHHPRLYTTARALRCRLWQLRYGLRCVHPTFYAGRHCQISRDLVAGAYAFCNSECHICPRVTLGAYVMLAPRVAIVGGDHIWDKAGVPIVFSGRPDMPATVIGADAWIGYGAVIMAGVEIGRGAIIAAGAVVTKDIPPYEVWGGVPAGKIGDRFTSVEQRELHDRMLADPPAMRGEFCQPRA